MPAPAKVEARAPAKVNLALHVTGRRDDGYHLLDSLVVFVGIADRLTVTAADDSRLSVTGPMSEGVPTDGTNLVLRAAALYGTGAEIALDKHLPAAAGIGGGSSDAAACLAAMARLHGRPLPPAEAILGLGADVPVCLSHAPQRMRGIGDALSPVPPLPPLWAVLVNPRVPVSTPAVFAALARRDNPRLPEILPEIPEARVFCDWLSAQRNDLQAPAMTLRPVIGEVLDRLSASTGCLLARMSGSGATCFGLFRDEAAARAVAQAIASERTDWWVASGPLLTSGGPLGPS